MPSLPPNDFRTRRNYLPDQAFALPAEGPDPQTDRIRPEAWHAMFALTDDVALRTTSFQGALAEHCHDAWVAVITTLPRDQIPATPLLEALLDLSDHLRSATFSALHGYYRQAFATLRAALELVIVTARFAVFEGLDALRA
jgi:hypothetical protein